MRNSLSALGLVILVATVAGIAATADDGAGGVRVAPALDAQLRAGASRLPVIVHLRAPAAARERLSRRDRSAERRRQDVIAPLLEEQLRTLGKRVRDQDLHVVRRLRLQPAFAAVVSPRGLAELLGSPAVELVEPDPTWRLHTEQGLPMINATVVHRLGVEGRGAAVAVIDTGVDATHPALGGSDAPNSKVVYQLDTADGDPDASDCGVHGTAVAAVIAGSSYQWNPVLRFAGGVAPEARILAYKATPTSDCGSFALSAVLAAMEDALLHRDGDGYSLAAINLSVGAGAFAGPCEGLSASYRRAVADATAAGVAVVASAGNQGRADAMAAPACLGDVISVGSVWDADAGSMEYGFCLDPACTTTCDDSFAVPGTVACYSNSSAALDLLAPSEYLTTARAGAQTLSFGGTSGAAAYVTGAVALIASSSAATGPAGLRALLTLTGRPVVDRRNGRVRPLVDVAAALDHPTLIATATPEATGVEAGGVVASSVTVGEPVRVGSLRVLVHLACDRPEQLRLTLSAPDGTSVLLHDRGPGSVPDIDGLTRFGGLWGTYPDDLEPAESLGLLAGLPAQGTWTLELADAGGGTPPAATLLDWALAITPRTAPAPSSLIIPVVAHVQGVDHSLWTTDLRLLNPSPAATLLRLTLVPSGADGRHDFYQSDVRLPAGMGMDLPDVVRSVFARDDSTGVLHLDAEEGTVLVTSRTATAEVGGGSYGQLIGPMSAVAGSLAVGEPGLVLLHLSGGDDVRTNLGFAEISGHPVTLGVQVRDGGSGELLGRPLEVELPAFSHLQLRLRGPGRAGPNMYAEVTAGAGEGRAMAYASTVDNATQDAVFIPAARPAPVPELMVPVVASTRGRGGTRWRSEVRVANLGPRQVALRLEYRPRQGEPGAVWTAEATVAAGRVLRSEDVVGELFGLSGTAGSLRVMVDGAPAPILVTSRTANWTARGSFGQYVGAVRGGLRGRAVVLHADAGPGVRTNVGLCEVAGRDLRVRYALEDALGNPLGAVGGVDLEPYQLVQIDDIFGHVGAPPQLNARLQLAVDSGDGAYVAYASVVDAVTGDAIFVPAQPLSH